MPDTALPRSPALHTARTSRQLHNNHTLIIYPLAIIPILVSISRACPTSCLHTYFF